ncbi:DUF1343 domain-containing protein [Cyclobacteriaceae bacterium]|nr:DUF1343 domain-containing protein [Cyclobacteriaceae bacterium]
MKPILLLLLLLAYSLCAQIKVGAEQTKEYLPILKNKNIALVVNQTSTIGTTHLVDTLLSSGIAIQKVFAPEHGFRGKADAGQHVSNQTDQKTGLPIISLYGKNKKPSAEQLKGIQLVVFDIQDVGARFYTYISTMHYVMEACAENNIPVLILDRPNPNGHYVAGPVLDLKFKSFVGMHPIPIVHGLTIGELAQMINKEGWLKNNIKCELTIVKCQNYNHKTPYSLPIKPSPNLPNEQAIKLYPSLCLFEATEVSIGRGTTKPFQLVGSPTGVKTSDFTFTPKSMTGATNPKHKNVLCHGFDLSKNKSDSLSFKYLLVFYHNSANKEKFFTQPSFFNKLAGTDTLIQQIKAGKTWEEIKNSWEPQLQEYLTLRKKYLLYQDFE